MGLEIKGGEIMKKYAFYQLLNEQLAQYYRELDPLLKERKAIEDRTSQLYLCIEQTKVLLESERTRLGIKVAIGIPVMPSHRFTSMTLPEACRILLQENTRMILRQFEELLRKGGFQFKEGKNPGRQIHFTLIKIPQAKRGKDGVWEWREQA